MRLFFTLFSRFLFLLLITAPQLHLNAQQNGSFESWSPSGKKPPFNWIYPTGWTTNNATTEFITSGVNRNTYHYSGEFAAQIKTLNIFGTLTRSQLSLGDCQLDPPNYQVKAYTGGEPLMMVPDEVSFYYQLTTGNPDEYAVAEVLIKRGSGSSIPDTVYHGSLMLPAVDIYTEAKLSIPESGIHTATDSIVILFSSNDTNEIAVNILYVDDVSINYATSTSFFPGPNPLITLYPNPVPYGEAITISHPGMDMKTVKIYDACGRQVEPCLTSKNNEDQIIVDTRQLQPGLYFVRSDEYCSPFLVGPTH